MSLYYHLKNTKINRFITLIINLADDGSGSFTSATDSNKNRAVNNITMHIASSRLIIRPVTAEDRYALYSYRSDPNVNAFLSLVPQSVADIDKFIRNSAQQINIAGTWYQVALTEKETNAVIGDIGIHFLDNGTANAQVEIGYTLDPAHSGKGYATEGLSAVITYLFATLGKHRIIASIDPENTASIRLVTKLGFRKEAHFIKSLLFKGQWVDDLIYALLAEEWKDPMVLRPVTVDTRR